MRKLKIENYSADMGDVFKGLFNYCFPKDFTKKLRHKLMTATQGKSLITDFIRDIEIMAGHVPDVNDRGIIEIFWAGMHRNIRARVLEMGGNPEHSSLE